jgi:hypothetical protein
VRHAGGCLRAGDGLLRQWDVLRAALIQADLAAQEHDALRAEVRATLTARQDPAPVRDDAPAEPPDHSTRSAGQRWWRRMTGGAVDLS